jgi:hypothetical protein
MDRAGFGEGYGGGVRGEVRFWWGRIASCGGFVIRLFVCKANSAHAIEPISKNATPTAYYISLNEPQGAGSAAFFSNPHVFGRRTRAPITNRRAGYKPAPQNYSSASASLREIAPRPLIACTTPINNTQPNTEISSAGSDCVMRSPSIE